MLFTSPAFLFAFLPVFLAVYFLAPSALKNIVLLCASLLFYFATSGELTTILIVSILVNWALALRIHAASPLVRRLWLVGGLALNLFPLLFYKYAGFFLALLDQAAATIGLPIPQVDLHPILPIGISFFTFQAISYIADVYLRRVAPARSLVDFGMYHACFPQLIAGPIVRYEEIEPAVHHRPSRLAEIHDGIVQFCFGLAKKAILADPLGQLADKAFSLPQADLTPAAAWLGLLAYTLQIYADFSGYSDMAIGLGRLLGFHYPENFDQPYRSRSVTEFWRRWHMTLSRWFRDYVYIPMGGNRVPSPRVLVNLAAVFFLCGLWHGAAVPFIVWGLYHGALLIAERLLRNAFPLTRLPGLLGWTYSILAVMTGWVLFRANSLTDARHYLGALFYPGSTHLPPAFSTIITPDKITSLVLAVGVALIPFQRFVTFGAEPGQPRRYGFGPIPAALSLAAAGLAIVFLSVSSFTPFIYFRF